MKKIAKANTVILLINETFSKKHSAATNASRASQEALISYNVKDFKNAEFIFKHKIITPEDFIKEML